jgi:uncharacterized Zn finger protein
MRKKEIKLLKIKDDRICPQCGKQMKRIHRKISDRLVSMIVPVIRCYCCGKSYRVRVDRNETLPIMMF